MTIVPSEVRRSVAVIGGLHCWPVLHAYFDRVEQVPDAVASYDDALTYVDAEYGPAVLAPVQLALHGAFDNFGALVLDRDHTVAFSYLQELHRRGLIPGLPPMHIFDFIVDSGETIRQHNGDELDLLRKFCERSSHRAWNAAEIMANLADEWAMNHALAALQRRRRHGLVSGVAAKELMARRRGGRAQDIAEAAAAIPDIAPAAIRVVLIPPSSTASTSLHGLIEEAGASVVAEHDWYGSRSIAVQPSEESADVMAELVTLVAQSAATDRVHPMSRRMNWLKETLAGEPVDVVILAMDFSDGMRGWDTPHFERIAAAQGVPTLRIAVDDLPGPTQLELQLRDLVAR